MSSRQLGLVRKLGVPTVFICKLRLHSILIRSGIKVYFFINLYSRPTLCPVPLALFPCIICEREAKVVQTINNSQCAIRNSQLNVEKIERFWKIQRFPDSIYMQAPLAQHTNSVGHRSLLLYQFFFSTFPLPCALSPVPLKRSRTYPPYPNFHRTIKVRGI